MDILLDSSHGSTMPAGQQMVRDTLETVGRTILVFQWLYVDETS